MSAIRVVCLGTVTVGLALALACTARAPSAEPASPSVADTPTSGSAPRAPEPPPVLPGPPAGLTAQILERGGGAFEYDFCHTLPPALIEPEGRDEGCELPNHQCVRDEAGRILENGVGAEPRVPAVKLLRYSYDAEGRLATSEVERSGFCIVQSTYERDEQGRIVREVLRDHCESEVSYWVAYAYDAAGRLSTIEDVRDYGAPNFGTRTRRLDYDANGLLTGSEDEDGSVTELFYDQWGHCAGMSIDGQVFRRYERASDGTVLVVEDEWTRAALERDGQNRVGRKAVDAKVGDDPQEVVEYDYDAGGHCTAARRSNGARCDYDPPYPGPCPGTLEPNPFVGCVENY